MAGHPKPPHASRSEVLCMRVRLLGECAQLKPSLLRVFVRSTRKSEDADPSAQKTSKQLLSWPTGPSSTKDCLMWHGDRLLLRAGRRLLSAIEPDSEWPGMWRARLPDGHLSDMTNRTRAKDAAQLLALATLNSAEGKQHDTGAPRGFTPPRDRRPPASSRKL
jgi:hypothetical protein